MEEKARNDIDVLIGEHYVPSELERKKSLMMYVIRGILLALSQGKASRYEQFHLKQSLGRWTMFFLLLIPALVLSFIPLIKILPLLAYIALLAVWVLFFLQAWKGTYTSFDKEKAFLPIFGGFGGWVLQIFDMQISADGQLQDGQVVSGEQIVHSDQPMEVQQVAAEPTSIEQPVETSTVQVATPPQSTTDTQNTQ